MKRAFFIYAFVMIAALIWNGCSKSKDPNQDSDYSLEFSMAKDAFQLEIVEAKFSEPLLHEEYDAQLGGLSLKLARLDENTLVFYVPSDFTPGATTLKIPLLKAQAQLTVKKSVLNGNETAVMEPFLENLHLSKNLVSDQSYSTYLNNTLTAFDEYYNSLSSGEKKQMALFYQVNKSWFEEVFSFHIQPQGFARTTVSNTMKKITKFVTATVIFSSSGYLLAAPGTPLEKSIIAVVGVTAAVLAWDLAVDLIGEINVVTKVTQDMFGDISARDPLFKNKLANSSVETKGLDFLHNQVKNVNLYLGLRKVIVVDGSNTSESMSIFFDTYKRLVTITETVNEVIKFVNDKVFFSKISLISIREIPSAAPLQSAVLTSEDFNSLNFTLSDANVKLSDVAFKNEGISMKMTITNPATVIGNSIKTTLNYTYQNEFSNAKGSIPIEVKLKELCDRSSVIGTWKIEQYNTCYPNPDGSPAYRKGSDATIILHEDGTSVHRNSDGTESKGEWTYYPNSCSFTYNTFNWCGGATGYAPSSPNYGNLYSCGCLSLKHIKQ